MNEELFEHKLEVHDNRLNNHADRLDVLEQNKARVDEKILSLCDQLSSLTTTLRWFIGLLVGSFAAFFFYAVQNLLK